jgi:hypothetical protein
MAVWHVLQPQIFFDCPADHCFDRDKLIQTPVATSKDNLQRQQKKIAEGRTVKPKVNTEYRGKTTTVDLSDGRTW